MTSSKIVFFGNERLSTGFNPHGAPTLQKLIGNNYNVVAVISNYSRGTSRSARHLEIEEVAQKNNIPVLLPARLGDITGMLTELQADLGVLVAYGKIIPQNIIDIFPRGIVNIHPSLLPAYRGPTPIEQAMLDGVAQTGVSLMQLVKAMDAGPLYAQITFPLKGSGSKQELTMALLNKGGELLIKHLPSILDGTAPLTTQKDSLATYSKLLRKQDGILDLTKPATQLERQVRAFAVWPKSKLKLFNNSVTVTGARVAASPTDGVLVLPCGHNTWLEITRLTGPSGRTMDGTAFMRGYRPSGS